LTLGNASTYKAFIFDPNETSGAYCQIYTETTNSNNPFSIVSKGVTGLTAASISSSGAATFAGDTVIGANTTGSGNVDKAGAYIGKEGYLTLFKPEADTTTEFMVGRRYGTTDKIFEIEADGDATFQGSITAGTFNIDALPALT
jgi:hypothetical protein